MERLTSFDYLHEPLPTWLADVQRARLPRRARSSALALTVAMVVLISCIGIQHERASHVERAWIAAQGALAAARSRLSRSSKPSTTAGFLSKFVREIIR